MKNHDQPGIPLNRRETAWEFVFTTTVPGTRRRSLRERHARPPATGRSAHPPHRLFRRPLCTRCRCRLGRWQDDVPSNVGRAFAKTRFPGGGVQCVGDRFTNDPFLALSEELTAGLRLHKNSLGDGAKNLRAATLNVLRQAGPRLGPVNTNGKNMLRFVDGTDTSTVRPYSAVPSGAAG